MAVIITLILGTLGARLVGPLGPESWDYVDRWPQAIAVGLAAMFVMTGVAHFAPSMRRDMIAIVPPRLPAAGLLVTITGVLELVGAAGLLYPPTRVASAVCLFLLMLVMFPANLYASRMPNPPKSMRSRLDVRTAEEIVYLGAAVVVGLGSIQ
ncbi:MAG: hypothetical protein V7643_3869 [Mycobacterium sp.]|jgi:uncharacterized membrane protein